VGFGSAEAFTHAFGARFGCSPTTWRLQQSAGRMNSNTDQANSKPDQAERHEARKNGVPNVIKTETPMKVEVIERKPTPIAYLRHVGPYGEPIGAFWQARVYPWMVTHGLIGQPSMESVTMIRMSRQLSNADTTPDAKFPRTLSRVPMRIGRPFRVENTQHSASRESLPTSNRRGMRSCAIGFHPADCSSIIAPCLSTTRSIQATIRRPECSSANCVFP